MAGWIYHMMVDDAVTRAISVMDRLARIVCLVASVTFSNNKVYFRSQKLQRVHEVLGKPESHKLVELATDDLYNLLLDYRDGLAHERKSFAPLAGFPPGDYYVDEGGQVVMMSADQWTGEYLFALANAAYQQCVAALHEVTAICEQELPKQAGTRL